MSTEPILQSFLPLAHQYPRNPDTTFLISTLITSLWPISFQLHASFLLKSLLSFTSSSLSPSLSSSIYSIHFQLGNINPSGRNPSWTNTLPDNNPRFVLHKDRTCVFLFCFSFAPIQKTLPQDQIIC